MSAAGVDELITGGIDLARKIADTYPLPRGADRPNVEGAALLGLTKAALSFDPDKGVPFGSYARRRIHGEILDALRVDDHLSRATRAHVGDGTSKLQVSELGPSSLNLAVRTPESMSDCVELIDFVADDTAGDAFDRVDMRLTLLNCLGRLSERQLAVIALRYFGGFTERELGHVFSLSDSRISQISIRGARKMAHDQETAPAPGRSKPIPASGLTEREAQIVALVSEGMSNQQIARELCIGIETVKSHIKHVIAKWGAHDRAHVVGQAYRRGVLRAAA